MTNATEETWRALMLITGESLARDAKNPKADLPTLLQRTQLALSLIQDDAMVAEEIRLRSTT